MIFTPIASFLGILFVPFFILIGLNAVDYLTGLLAAKYRSVKISSNVGFKGIVKKICMWLLVGLGCIFDWAIVFMREFIGVQSPKITFLIGTFVCLWLMCNEIISILENMKDIGVKFPRWMLKLTKNIKSKIDKNANDIIEKDKDE